MHDLPVLVRDLDPSGCRCDGGQPKNFVCPCLLLLLAEAPAPGYEFLDPVYKTLQALEHDGHVISEWELPTLGPHRSLPDAPLRGCPEPVRCHRAGWRGRPLDDGTSRRRTRVTVRSARRRAHAATVLTGGKYPHPQTIAQGDIRTTATLQTLNERQTRLFELLDHAKKMALLWDDLFNFLYEAAPRYLDVGKRDRNRIDLGSWDHHDAYDATYANAAACGDMRRATPGVALEDRDLAADVAVERVIRLIYELHRDPVAATAATTATSSGGSHH